MTKDLRTRRMGRVALAGLVGVLAAGAGQAAEAHRTELSVEVISVQAALAPDGRSISFDIETRCDRKATVLDARVSVVQSQASGEAAFTPTCNRIPTVVGVTVPVLNGVFRTGEAQASALLVVRQGSTKQARDSGLLRVRPSVSVRVADEALLVGAGEAVQIGVTVTCPVRSNPQGGQVNIYQGQAAGTGIFGPTPCDGAAHSQSVTVRSSGGLFQVGTAQAEAFASVEEGGDIFPGTDLRMIQIK
jgi:hypothetical protein